MTLGYNKAKNIAEKKLIKNFLRIVFQEEKQSVQQGQLKKNITLFGRILTPVLGIGILLELFYPIV